MPITYTSHEQVEVYRFSPPVAILVPLLAVFLQAFVPLRFHFFSIFDLPLLVVIFFGVARRNPVSGMLTGAAIGILQDALTPSVPIGVFGIANTVVGYGASSLGVKIDVDNMASRFLVTIFFCVVHEIVYFTVASGLVGITVHWSWPHELASALANVMPDLIKIPYISTKLLMTLASVYCQYKAGQYAASQVPVHPGQAESNESSEERNSIFAAAMQPALNGMCVP